MVIYLFNCLTYIAIIEYGNFCCLVNLRITYYCKLSKVKNRGSLRKSVVFSVGSFRCLDTFHCIFTKCTNFNTQTSIVHERFRHQFDDFINIFSVILSHERLAGESVICSNRTYLQATKFIHLTFFSNQESIFISKNLTLMADSF